MSSVRFFDNPTSEKGANVIKENHKHHTLSAVLDENNIQQLLNQYKDVALETLRARLDKMEQQKTENDSRLFYAKLFLHLYINYRSTIYIPIENMQQEYQSTWSDVFYRNFFSLTTGIGPGLGVYGFVTEAIQKIVGSTLSASVGAACVFMPAPFIIYHFYKYYREQNQKLTNKIKELKESAEDRLIQAINEMVELIKSGLILLESENNKKSGIYEQLYEEIKKIKVQQINSLELKGSEARRPIWDASLAFIGAVGTVWGASHLVLQTLTMATVVSTHVFILIAAICLGAFYAWRHYVREKKAIERNYKISGVEKKIASELSEEIKFFSDWKRSVMSKAGQVAADSAKKNEQKKVVEIVTAIAKVAEKEDTSVFRFVG